MKKRLLILSLFTFVVSLMGFAQNNNKNVPRPQAAPSPKMIAWIEFLGNNSNSSSVRKAPRKAPASWSYPSSTTSDPFGGGSGTSSDPYIISTAQQLANLAYEVNNGNNYSDVYFKMTTDIELNSNVLESDGSLGSGSYQSWTPIGNKSNIFRGNFDGDGHNISGIYINASSLDYQGLFGRAADGLISNLGVKDSYISGCNYVGGIVGHSDHISLSNCYNEATVIGSFDVGGLVGDDCGAGGMYSSVSSSSITGCANYGLVTATSNCIAGIIGYGNEEVTVSYCINYATITGTGDCVGGIDGESSCKIENCANTGTISITGSDTAYGAICYDSYATNCYYLEGSCDQAGDGTSKTAAEFADGTVTNLLDPSGTYFEQGADGLPALKNLNKGTSPAAELTVPGTVIWSSDEGETVDWGNGKSIAIPAENFADVKVGDILNVGVLGAPEGANPDNWGYQIGLQDPTVWKFIEANLPLNQSGDYVHSFVVTGDMLKYMQAHGVVINGAAFNVKKVAVESAYSGSDESIWVGDETLTGWPPVTIYPQHFENANDFAGVEAGQIIRVNCTPAAGLSLKYQGADTSWGLVDYPGLDLSSCATETGYDIPVTDELVSILKTDRMLLLGDGSVKVTSVEIIDASPADPSDIDATLTEIDEAKKLLRYSMTYYDEHNSESPDYEGKLLVDAIRDAETEAEDATSKSKLEKALEALKQAEIDYADALMDYELAESELILADADSSDELAAELQRLYDTQDVVREDYENQPKNIKNYADRLDEAQKAYLRNALNEQLPKVQALASNPDVKTAIDAANKALEGDRSEDLYDALTGLQSAFDAAIGEMTPLNGDVATFEDLTLESESFWQGTYDEERDEYEMGMCFNTFQSGSFQFDNYYSPEYGGYWGNFAYSNQTSTDFTSLADQFHAITGGGHESTTFGVAYPQGGAVTFMDNDEGTVIPGFYITNSSYTYTSMLNGDAYAKKFEQGDWLKLTITGFDADGNETGTKEFYLADFRDDDSSKHYIVNDWRYVDLSGLGKVKSVKFILDSTDRGTWGMNTPGYFCLDDFGANGIESQPEGNVPTAINGVTVNESAADAPVFNLAGQRVGNNVKGIVIINGKKVIRK